MEPFLRYMRQMTWVILAAGAAIAVGLWFVGRPATWYGSRIANGYLLGLLAAVAALRFVDVPTVVASVARRTAEGATKMYFVKLLKNLALFGGALLVIFLNRGWFEPWGAVLGFITPRAVMVIDSVVRPNLFPAPPPETDDEGERGEADPAEDASGTDAARREP